MQAMVLWVEVCELKIFIFYVLDERHEKCAVIGQIVSSESKYIWFALYKKKEIKTFFISIGTVLFSLAILGSLVLQSANSSLV